jgi:hypothetical protein
MVKRFQLMEPQRALRPRLANATSRLRDGLLRDNKVIPSVVGALALTVFAWILAGALIDDPNGGGGGQQVVNRSNQSNQPPQRDQAAQSPDQAQGIPESPAPSVENRDAESYAAFEQKDPFRDLFQPLGTDGATDPDADGGRYDDGSTDDGTGDDSGDGTGDGTSDGSGGDDFIDQTFPDDGSRGGGDGSGGGGGGSGGGGGDDDGLYDSGGELFGSGGNLAP